MLYDDKFIVSRLALGSIVCHSRLQRNASVHQGRLPSEVAMVKMIIWEVKIRVECNSYCNFVQNRRICCLWGYFVFFRIVAVNGPFLLELIDLAISFCNVYGAMQAVSVLVLYCLVVFWTDGTFVFFNELLIHPKQKIASSSFFFMAVSAVFVISEMAHLRMNELLVIGFILGVKGVSMIWWRRKRWIGFSKINAALQFLFGCKTSKYDGILKNAQNQLEILGLCIQDLEGGQEYLIRRLIETRVSIL